MSWENCREFLLKWWNHSANENVPLRKKEKSSEMFTSSLWICLCEQASASCCLAAASGTIVRSVGVDEHSGSLVLSRCKLWCDPASRIQSQLVSCPGFMRFEAFCEAKHWESITSYEQRNKHAAQGISCVCSAAPSPPGELQRSSIYLASLGPTVAGCRIYSGSHRSYGTCISPEMPQMLFSDSILKEYRHEKVCF